MTGRIIKIVAGVFTVAADNGKRSECTARGLFRHKETDLYVGDIVEYNDGVVESVAPRKNFFVRPYVANIDQIAVVTAPSPPPDRMLLDKFFIKSDLENIRSLLIINKSDTDAESEFERSIILDYKDAADDIITVSATTGRNLKALRAALAGNLSAFAGQSAVGKSSLLNALASGLRLETGDLSKRVERGRHTTRHSEIFELENGSFIADTPGFSLYNLEGVTAASVGTCYRDLFKFLPECKYNMCTHTKESAEDCAVKRAVTRGDLSRGRYERYIKLFEELLTNEKKKY